MNNDNEDKTDFDINGPPPIEYHARQEWNARRTGVPPSTTTCMFGTCYNIPINYPERKELFERYAKYKR